jgi:hypothetical protein
MPHCDHDFDPKIKNKPEKGEGTRRKRNVARQNNAANTVITTP